MSNINDFKDLRIWQKGMDIAEKCYLVTKNFPKDELYGMVQQIRRSAASIPANIAEGYGRRATKVPLFPFPCSLPPVPCSLFPVPFPQRIFEIFKHSARFN